MRHTALLLTCLALAACGAPARPPVPVAPPPPMPAQAAVPAPPPLIVQFQSVWSRTPGLLLRGETSATALPYIFMRLEVLRADTTDLLVRCVTCPGAPEGWVAREGVVHAPADPAAARQGDLAEFALAVRDAAARRDVQALRRAMSRDFSYTLAPVAGGTLEALAQWEREGYRGIDRLPFQLDQGIAAVPGTPIWAAPPEYGASLGYQGLRAGFRHGADGWEWIFLVSGGS